MRRILTVVAVVLVSFASLAQNIPPATRTVTGTRLVHYLNVTLPANLSTKTIAAYVPSGTSGYTVYPGTGTSSGTFTIPNVPTGFYLLQFNNKYVWTSNSNVNADVFSQYEYNLVTANSATTVTFDITNLNPWQSTDIFEMVCPNNVSYMNFSGTAGETTFSGTYPYVGQLSNRWASGDQYYIAQLATQDVGGFAFTGLTGYFAPPQFTQAQGSNTTISGSLLTIPQTGQFEANINGADLLAQSLAANPSATYVSSGVGVSVNPGTLAHGQTTDTSDLVLYLGLPTLGNGDLGSVSYGNPYPSTFPVYVGYFYQAGVNYLAPGATNSTQIVTYDTGTNPTLPTSTSPLAPLVGVVGSPAINGLDFFSNQTGVGTTPLLQWAAPSVGSATFYVVVVYQLSNLAGNTVATSIASLRTQRTSVLMPPGLLTSGQAYVFVVRSYYVPSMNFANTPFQLGPVNGSADVISGMIQP